MSASISSRSFWFWIKELNCCQKKKKNRFALKPIDLNHVLSLSLSFRLHLSLYECYYGLHPSKSRHTAHTIYIHIFRCCCCCGFFRYIFFCLWIHSLSFCSYERFFFLFIYFVISPLLLRWLLLLFYRLHCVIYVAAGCEVIWSFSSFHSFYSFNGLCCCVLLSLLLLLLWFFFPRVRSCI